MLWPNVWRRTSRRRPSPNSAMSGTGPRRRCKPAQPLAPPRCCAVRRRHGFASARARLRRRRIFSAPCRARRACHWRRYLSPLRSRRPAISWKLTREPLLTSARFRFVMNRSIWSSRSSRAADQQMDDATGHRLAPQNDWAAKSTSSTGLTSPCLSLFDVTLQTAARVHRPARGQHELATGRLHGGTVTTATARLLCS